MTVIKQKVDGVWQTILIGEQGPPGPATSLPFIDLGDPSGSGDDTAVAAALAEAVTLGGGHIVFRSGATYEISDDYVWDNDDGPLVISAYGATIEYSGANIMFTITCGSGGGGSSDGSTIHGGKWQNMGSGTHGFRILDASRNTLSGVWVREFLVAAVELRNVTSYTEQTLITGCRLTAGSGIGDHCILFSPQSVTGGTGGTQSFARTRVVDTPVAGGSAGSPLIYCRGGVYDSKFDGLSGNIYAGAHVFHLEGTMGGTSINNLGFEGGSSASRGFVFGTFTGNKPYIGPNVDFRSPIVESDTAEASWSRPTSVWGDIDVAGVIEMAGFPFVREYDITILSGVAYALSDLNKRGAFLIVAHTTGQAANVGVPIGIWATTKLATASATANVSSLSNVSPGSGIYGSVVLTLTWPTNAVPNIAATGAAVDVPVRVFALGWGEG